MRLTLRTLLAHLDQILDEPDAEELERKIQESELATQLVHRIRSVLAQRRLESLDVHVQGMGRDANSVAEYLDNTLAADAIPEFERACLESDVHLSEVAACHQILTLVLGEPAAIPEGLKEAIYRLPQQHLQLPLSSTTPDASPDASPDNSPDANVPLDAPDVVPVATPVAEPDVVPRTNQHKDTDQRKNTDQHKDDDVLGDLLRSSSGPAEPRVRHGATASSRPSTDGGETWDEDEHWTEAPDYLKRPRQGRWKPVAIATLIAFCLAMAGLRGMGPLDRSHPLAQRFGLFGPPVSATELADTDTPPAGQDPGSVGAEETGSDVALTEGESAPVDATGRGVQGDDDTAVDPRDTTIPPLDGTPEADAPAAADLAESTPPAESGVETDLDDPSVQDGLDFPDFPAADPSDVAGESVDDQETDRIADRARDEQTVAPDLVDSPEVQSSDDASPSDLPSDGFPSGVDVDVDGDAGDIAAASVEPDPAADSSLKIRPNRPDLDSEPPLAGPTLINPLANDSSDDRSIATTVPPIPEPRDAGSLDLSTHDEGNSPDAPTSPRNQEIGRFLDTQQVLVKLDGESDLWKRVAVGTRLQVGDLLMSLPTFRSPLVLASGMQVRLIGGTQVEVLSPDAESNPFFRLDFGRLTVATFAQTGTHFGLRWAGNRSGILTLGDTNTTLAIELRPQHMPGAPPEDRPAYQVLHIYVTSGSAEWNSDQGPAIQITAGQRMTSIDDYSALLKDMPDHPAWIDGRDARPRDPIAARDLAQRLTGERPVSLVLKEDAESRRFERRSLAVCSLAYLGDFDPLFVGLNDPKLRAYWPALYEVLETVPSNSPEFMATAKQSIMQRHGDEDGAALYRMLWGFSPQQLADGADADLFNALSHPSLDFRIVASEMLKSITGQPSLYRANAGERDPQRRAAISRWRKMLEQGKIAYQHPPEIVELLSKMAPEE